MKKGLIIFGIVVGILILIILVVALVSPGSPSPDSQTDLPSTPSPTTNPTPKATSDPIVITGAGDRTSPPFAVTTKEWIIDWSYTTDSEYPGFSFYVYPRGETTGYIESVSTGDEERNGTTYVYAAPREYYVEVIAANLNSWQITIRPA